jgi:hypothetical protein
MHVGLLQQVLDILLLIEEYTILQALYFYSKEVAQLTKILYSEVTP